jgi:hypothetical protein
MYNSTLSLTSALDGVGVQRHASSTLPPGTTRYPSYRRLHGPQGRSGQVRKISPPRDSIPGPSIPLRFSYIYISLWYEGLGCLFAYVTSAIILDCVGQSVTVFFQTVLISLCSSAVKPACWFAGCQALREQPTPINLHVVTFHQFGHSDTEFVSGAMYSRVPCFRTQCIVRFRFVL